MQVKIATNIDTVIFYSIIEYLEHSHWELIAEYDQNLFDKGVDFDFYEFFKDGETVLLAWTNWFEGEMKASAATLEEIANYFKIKLEYNEPEYLHRPELMETIKGLVKYRQ